jgi:hypothetical protein
VPRRFAAHQLRHAHAVEMAREGVPLIVIQRQLGHTNLREPPRAVKDTTVRAHVIGLTANHPSRHHYRWLAKKTPLFFKLERGTLTGFDPDQHRADLVGSRPEQLADGASVKPVDAEQMPAFALQFAIERVPEYAARYAYDDDSEVLTIGRVARDRGHYTREEFVKVCRWKTPRSTPLVELNSAESVEAATRAALSRASSEREVGALRSLRGVDWATASVLLHLAYPERYPILDKRALHALGARAPTGYSFRFWEAYVNACVRLANQAGVGGRTFDQALWQWSKEQGVPLY